MQISVQADIKEATRGLYNFERKHIPRATNSALNKTAQTVLTKTRSQIAKKSGLTVKEIRPYMGTRKSTFLTLSAQVYAKRRTFNLIRFVSKSKQFVGAQWNKGKSPLRARPWRRSQPFPGAFIMRGRGGNLIVAARKGLARAGVRGLYGPGVHIEFVRPAMRRYQKLIIRKRFPIEFKRNLKYFISRGR